jgi:hypothetical protein
VRYDAFESIFGETQMPMLTGETVRKALHDLYDYEISDADAAAIAHGVGALFTLAQDIKSVGLDDVAPPFGYPILAAEADRLAKQKR